MIMDTMRPWSILDDQDIHILPCHSPIGAASLNNPLLKPNNSSTIPISLHLYQRPQTLTGTQWPRRPVEEVKCYQGRGVMNRQPHLRQYGLSEVEVAPRSPDSLHNHATGGGVSWHPHTAVVNDHKVCLAPHFCSTTCKRLLNVENWRHVIPQEKRL